MNDAQEEILTYRIEVIDCDNGGYGHTYITLSPCTPRSVVRKIANCTKDPNYYGEPDQWEKLARLGHDTYYWLDCDKGVQLHWQHYTSDDGHESYCRHQIERCRRLNVMQWACKLLVGISRDIAKSLGRYYGPKDCYQYELDEPRAVVEALERMKAKRIEVVRLGGYASEFVDAFSPLPVWRGKEEEVA